MSGMDNAQDLSSVNNASGSTPVAPAPAASDADAPPLAANVPPVKVEDSGACIELEDLQKHKVTFLGYKRGTGIDWWVRLEDGRAGWARDVDIAVALPEEQIQEAEKKFGLAKTGEQQRRRVRRRVAGPSHLREKALPPGWHREQHRRQSGGQSGVVYHKYRGPGGLRARSVPETWRKHGGEDFEDGDEDEVTLPDHNAATEADEMLDVVMRAENRETPSEATDAKDAEAMATEPLEARPATGPAAVLWPAAEPSSAKRVCGTRIGASVCGRPAFHLGPCQGEAVCPRRRCVPAPKMESIKSFRIFGSCGYVTGANDKVDHPVPDRIGADIEVYSALEDKWNRGTIIAINATEVYAEEGKRNFATVFDVEYSTTTLKHTLFDGIIRWRFAEPKPPASSSGACGRASKKARVADLSDSESMGEPPSSATTTADTTTATTDAVAATPATSDPSPPEIAAVAAALARIGLQAYAAAFVAQGYDDITFLRGLDAPARADVAKETGMKPGHAGKFAKHGFERP